MKTTKKFEEFLANIGGHLAELRISKGFDSIKEFARTYELPEIQYWRIERGKANITLKSLAKILAIHKISVRDFFCMVTDPHISSRSVHKSA